MEDYRKAVERTMSALRIPISTRDDGRSSLFWNFNHEGCSFVVQIYDVDDESFFLFSALLEYTKFMPPIVDVFPAGVATEPYYYLEHTKNGETLNAQGHCGNLLDTYLEDFISDALNILHGQMRKEHHGS